MQKTTRFAPFSTLLLASLVALVACADPGNVPVIDELAVDPGVLSVGSPTHVNASFSFADPDGDALETTVTIRTPDGLETSTETPLVGAARRKGQPPAEPTRPERWRLHSAFSAA